MPADKVWDAISELRFCMLVTRSETRMRARPMTAIPMQDEGKIYVLADRKGRVDEEVKQTGAVLLVFSNASSKHVSLAASAAVDESVALKKRLWNTGAQAFWPDGPEDPDVVALVLTPIEADYWLGAGSIMGAAKIAIAAVSGRPPDMGEEGHAEF